MYYYLNSDDFLTVLLIINSYNKGNLYTSLLITFKRSSHSENCMDNM